MCALLIYVNPNLLKSRNQEKTNPKDIPEDRSAQANLRDSQRIKTTRKALKHPENTGYFALFILYTKTSKIEKKSPKSGTL